MPHRVLCLLATAAAAAAGRARYLLNDDWRFQEVAGERCSGDHTKDFPTDYSGQQCLGLSRADAAGSEAACARACCEAATCEIYQWCGSDACGGTGSSGGCWIGGLGSCHAGAGWVSRARPPVKPPTTCDGTPCDPTTPDATWTAVTLPHDFVVGHNFTKSADMAHGYLPYGIGWYRKTLKLPDAGALEATDRVWLELEGVQSSSSVYLNGKLLGSHSSGYTPGRYAVDPAEFAEAGADGILLAVFVDATTPDGWWYDGGGIYRNVWLTVVRSAATGVAIKPNGVYTPSRVTGPVSWDASDRPRADAVMYAFVNITQQQQQLATDAITVSWSVTNVASGDVINGGRGGGVHATSDGDLSWNGSVAVPSADLWHVGVGALYDVRVTVVVAGTAVDEVTVRTGVRQTAWDAATGMRLNGRRVKVLGSCNHQDFAGVGVAVRDRLQGYRIAKLQGMGGNGWRTAHNAPSPALLDAADELGFLVWDENHRNGQDEEMRALVMRDRNHPSIVIWSICNEKLCRSGNDIPDALRLKAVVRATDFLMDRPVSANPNYDISTWQGQGTPLDVRGFDYNTGSYDSYFAMNPDLPAISSETSSAVSDRGEYKNDRATGHVTGYDTQYPAWGQSAQQAWGGIGIRDGQGILTRDYMAGGWTWTGFDYKGEPTPYSWPDINSHFGILDICGFEKDRYHWYDIWFHDYAAAERGGAPAPAKLHVFPHWNWGANDSVSVWSFSNAAEVELFLNGESLGRQASPKYGHVEWKNVAYAPGTLRAVGYNADGDAVVDAARTTTGAVASLRVSIRDNVGETLHAGCGDVALVEVSLVDADGAVVPTADDEVTLRVGGPAVYGGGGNGDPSSLTNDKAPTRAAYHGRLLGVVLGGDAEGTVRVTASAPGLKDVTLEIPQVTASAAVKSAWWCRAEPRL